MNNIVIAFPKMEIALKLKKILAQSGYTVSAVCTTGAQALQQMNSLDGGILICGTRFVDMMYMELYEYLPQGFQMLLFAPASEVLEREIENLVSISMPLKVHELLETVSMMEGYMQRRRKKQRMKPKVRNEEEQEMIRQAKELLMERNHFSEEEAHRYIQKRSMDNSTGLVETAQMILSLMGSG